MSDQAPGDDPFAILRDAYAKGLERWSEAMEEMVGRQDFAAASAQLLALYAQQQQSIRAASRVAAESIHMPTTEDLAEVAKLVVNVERKVDEVTEQATRISARLDAIEASLATLTELARAAAPAPTGAAKKPARARSSATGSTGTSRRRTPRADG